MMRGSAFVLAIVAAGTMALIAQELPESDGDDSFDVEPPVLVPNLEVNRARSGAMASTSATGIETLEKELERATRNAQGAERLFKMGVLAKAEVEQRALRVIRLRSSLEAARLGRIQEEIKLQEARAANGEISKEDLAETEVLLKQAVQAADAAAAKREQAELDAAETNLRRQKKLLALGVGRKSEVIRAEEKLAALKAPKS